MAAFARLPVVQRVVPQCRVRGCGAALFLRHHEGIVFDPRSLDAARSTVLYDRAGSLGPSPERWDDDVPF